MLEGVRVVELGVWVAGPAAGGILADWGADVIKVESPDGDPFRRMLQVTGGARGDIASPPFDLDNRGKRSVVLDLRTEEGRAAMDGLLATADVFLTNLRPEAVDELGLGPETVRAAHPRLVYASVTGYGREGPDAHRAGYDVGGFWARSGLASMAVPEGEPQPHFRGGVGDHVTALSALAGVLGALLERERTGEGRLVEVSLLRSGIYCFGWDLSMELRWGKLGAAQARTEQGNPMINVYRARDGAWFWLLGVEADRMWPKLLAAIDRAAWGEDDRWRTARDRRYNAVELIAELDALFATKDRDEWTAIFDEHDVWWAPVNTPPEVVRDPQAIATGAFVEVPEGGGAPAHKGVAGPVTFDGQPFPARPVPALGEHTDEVLAELRQSARRRAVTALEAAARVGAVAAERSLETEALRRLPADLVTLLVDEQLFRVHVPKVCGGGELDIASSFAVTEALAFHDGSTAWCQMIAATTGLLAGSLPEDHARALFGAAASVGGGFAAPMGTAEPAEGGVRVSGHWQWGSGTQHCTTIGGGTRFPDGVPRFVFMDASDVCLLDTWRVSGLKGTGSTDYVADGAFVPDGRWALLGGPPIADGPLYRFSFFGALALGVAAVASGLARRAIAELVELAAVKKPQGSSRPLAERPPIQADVAAAESAVRSARAFVDDAVGAAWTTVTAGGDNTVDERWQVRLAATAAVTAAALAVDLMYTAGGGASIFDDSPLQRVFRDVHVATQHAIVAPRTMELLGRIRFGLDTDTTQL